MRGEADSGVGICLTLGPVLFASRNLDLVLVRVSVDDPKSLEHLPGAKPLHP